MKYSKRGEVNKTSRLYSVIGSLGYRNITDFCCKNDIRFSSVHSILNGEKKVLDSDGNPTPFAEKLMIATGSMLNELFEPGYLEVQPPETAETEAETLYYQEADRNRDIDYIIYQERLREEVDSVLFQKDWLRERELQVIDQRFGLFGEQLTQVAIGENMLLSSTRIGQIEKKVLRRLRHPARNMVLRTFLFDDDFE